MAKRAKRVVQRDLEVYGELSNVGSGVLSIALGSEKSGVINE